MQIIVTSVMVDDQAKAEKFYVDILGFKKKHDVPVGEHRWLTVVSPEPPNDVELLLEPMGMDFARTFQKQLYEAGVPLTMFGVKDVQAEYDRLTKLGVKFKGPPNRMPGMPANAIFDDTCGNYIVISEPPPK